MLGWLNYSDFLTGFREKGVEIRGKLEGSWMRGDEIWVIL